MANSWFNSLSASSFYGSMAAILSEKMLAVLIPDSLSSCY